MDNRQERGTALATTSGIQQRGDTWIVPSQSAKGKRYSVNLDHGEPHCTCPDHEYRRQKCKHIYAVEYTVQHEVQSNGTEIVTESLKVSYTQDWSAYNAAQTEEKDVFMNLLADLTSGFEHPEQSNGRPRLPLSDMLFAAAFKVYSGFSSRRFTSDLRAAHARGLISQTPHFNSVSNYLATPDLTAILHQLIVESSKPLKSIESDFAVDATGFSTCRFVRWYNARYGKEQDNHSWVKVHLMCGVKTNIVTSVEVTGRYDHDAVQFAPLVERTSANFQLREVSADKAYSSKANFKLVDDKGGVPYISFKANATGWSGGVFERMFHLYQYQRESFFEHYHKRSNVESTFMMIKTKFGDRIRSKSDVAQVNEVLCKVLCHNICVVIQSIHELGIETETWRRTA